MQRHFLSVSFCLLAGAMLHPVIAADRDFSGDWKIVPSRSRLNDRSVPVDESFHIGQTPVSMTISVPVPGVGDMISVFPLDGTSKKYMNGELQKNTATKWEGAALLVNTIVTGPDDYSLSERWERSNDGHTLTIERNVVRRTGETESILVYSDGTAPSIADNPAPVMRPLRAPEKPALMSRQTPAPPPADYLVPAGTHVLLRLTNELNTKNAAVGDRVYLETAAPVFINGRLVIPVGSYVNGSVTETKEAGRVKGKSSLAVQYDSLTLRSGATRDLRARPDSVDTRGKLDHTEGRIDGEGDKGGDANKVAQTTAIGTGVGAVVGGAAGHLGMGAGIGAAAGAVGGLARVLGSRGPQVVLPRGTTMDMVTDRDLRYTDDELRGRVQ